MPHMLKKFSALLILCFTSLSLAQGIAPPSEQLQKQLNLSPFYKKSLDDHGLWIVSSEKPNDAALHEAAWIIDHMLQNREDLRKALIDHNIRIVVMAASEFT